MIEPHLSEWSGGFLGVGRSKEISTNQMALRLRPGCRFVSAAIHQQYSVKRDVRGAAMPFMLVLTTAYMT